MGTKRDELLNELERVCAEAGWDIRTPHFDKSAYEELVALLDAAIEEGALEARLQFLTSRWLGHRERCRFVKTGRAGTCDCCAELVVVRA